MEDANKIVHQLVQESKPLQRDDLPLEKVKQLVENVQAFPDIIEEENPS